MKMSAGLVALMMSALAMNAPVSAKEVLGMGTPNAQQFRAQASASDAFEVLSSRIALTHATNPELKAFAQMMIDAHTQTTDQLVALGGINKESLEAKMKPGADGKFKANALLSSAKANDLNSLNSKSNADFDKTYIDEQVSGHKDALSLMQDYAKNGDNAKLKAFAAETAPKVQQHLTKAEALQKQIEK